MSSMDPNLFLKYIYIFIHPVIYFIIYLAVSGPSWRTWTLMGLMVLVVGRGLYSTWASERA